MATWGGYDGTIIATRLRKTFIKDYLDLSGRLDVRNYDVSLNNRLFVLNDASFMGNMYINGNLTSNLTFISNADVSLNGNVFVGKDISCNGNVSIGRNLTISGNLTVQNYTSQNIINTTTTNYQLVVSEDLSLNGRLCVLNDASINGNLFVSTNISTNGNLRYNGSFLKDISINGMNIGIRNSIYNTVVGNLALATNTTGINNTAIGFDSITNNATGSNNTAFGAQSMRSQASGSTASNNTAIGLQVLGSNTSGGNITALGVLAGLLGVSNTTETNNTFIGSSTRLGTAGYTNSTALGVDATITGSNQIVLGRLNETVIIPRVMRHLAPPIIIRKATTAQNVNGSVDTMVKFPISVYDNGYTGLVYNDTTGYFTNTNSYPICLNISATANVSAQATSSGRTIWIETTGNTTYASGFSGQRYQIVFEPNITVSSAINVSGIIPLASGASMFIPIYFTVANATITTLNANATYPTVITIHVF